MRCMSRSSVGKAVSRHACYLCNDFAQTMTRREFGGISFVRGGTPSPYVDAFAHLCRLCRGRA